MLDIPQHLFADFIGRHGLVYVGRGSYRWTYRTRSGRFVVKFPKCREYGEADNVLEAEACRGGEPCIARCRLIRVAGYDCLVMEWVEPIDYTGAPLPLPDWVDWIDCQQVGHNRRGRLVAYDFA